MQHITSFFMTLTTIQEQSWWFETLNNTYFNHHLLDF